MVASPLVLLWAVRGRRWKETGKEHTQSQMLFIVQPVHFNQGKDHRRAEV